MKFLTYAVAPICGLILLSYCENGCGIQASNKLVSVANGKKIRKNNSKGNRKGNAKKYILPKSKSINVQTSKNQKSKNAGHRNLKTKDYNVVIAKVNDAVITKNDLQKAVRLTKFLSGVNIEKSQEQEFAREVLRERIHELLKEEALAKFIKMYMKPGQKAQLVTQNEIDEYYSDIADRKHMTVAGLDKCIKAMGIKKKSFLRRIKTNLGWSSYIRGRYSRNVIITNKEAKKIEREMKKKLEQEAYFVHRMFFPVLSKSEERSVLAHTQNIQQMISHGANFADLAQHFSKGVESKQGGIIGWVFPGLLSSQEMKALKEMQVGSYKIVRTDRGYSLLFLQDKKAPGPRVFHPIKFRQVGCSFANGLPDKEALQPLLKLVNDIRKSSKNIDEFIQKAQETEIMGAGPEMSGVLEQMLPEFRKNISSIRVGTTGKPIVMDGGIVVFCLLDKRKIVAKAPSAEEIKNQQMSESLSAFSERELSNLKKLASLHIMDSRYSFE